jgi:hypothetical protein
MPSLLELQSEVMRAILGADDRHAAQLVVARGIAAARRLGIYANTTRVNFQQSLRASFPAILRLVGDDYFHQCAREFHQRYPSNCGDLQYTGAHFPDYLEGLHAAGEYRYLGDVARLEWLRQEALLSADHPPLDFGKLAAVAPSDYGELRFRLHPATRMLVSDYPSLAIWRANVGSDREPEIIDLALGADRLLLTRKTLQVEVHRLSRDEHCFLVAVRRGERFSEAGEHGLECDGDFDAAATLQRFVLAGAIVDFE